MRKHSKANTAILSAILAHCVFIRIAGFASGKLHPPQRRSASLPSPGLMSMWAPLLFAYYATHMSALLKNDRSLSRPFFNSVFAALTLNFGPQTASFEHTDNANLPYGWCSLTALGKYKYKLGGHLILWDLHLVVEFPPGSTILIPSAVLRHSNTAIGRGETRYSFAQYTAGSLFRWVDHNFQKQGKFRATRNAEETKADVKEARERWGNGLKLFSTLEELTEYYRKAREPLTRTGRNN